MVERRMLFGGLTLAVLALSAGIASARPDVLPTGGTVGTRLSIIGSGFGDKPGKTNLVDTVSGATTKLKVVTWGDSAIVADVAKMPKSGFMAYTVSVTPKGGDYTRKLQQFTFSPLELASVSVESGVPGAEVTITGNYFGLKTGKVALRYPNPKKPTYLYKYCKVTHWEMDAASGASTAVVLVPKAAPGTYTLYVTNKISNATWSNDFEVLSPP